MQGILDAFSVAFALYLPRILAALLILVVAYIVASILKAITVRVLSAAHLDERLGSGATPAGGAGQGRQPGGLTGSLGSLVFWLVILLFLPGALGALNLGGILLPIQAMVASVLAFLPRLISAGLILFIGLFIARLLRDLVTNLLAGAGADRLGQNVNLAGAQRPSALAGLIIFVFVLIPVLTAALDALGLPAVTQPISDMLAKILSAIPNIFAAALVLLVGYVIGRLVAGLVTSILTGIGFDSLPKVLGLRMPARPGSGPSAIVGNLALVAVMLFALTQAMGLLDFVVLTALVASFIQLAGHILLGLIILALGMYLANLAAQAVMASGVPQANVAAVIARVAVLALVGAMALRQMGLANEIVNLAFGITLGAVAVAGALAFGLGGRETAARILEQWRGGVAGAPPVRPASDPGGDKRL